MSLSKNQLKLITSLSQKKYRYKHKLFIAEGIKVVNEFLNSSLKIHTLFSTDTSISTIVKDKTHFITETELKKISSLTTPNKVLAIFEIPDSFSFKEEGLIIALDGINDPGNLGTIIRLCDWFGIHSILCSENTVDCYNKKVIQASMGSLTRVQIVYIDLHLFLSKTTLPIFIANMDGKNIHKTNLPKEGILVMGNEANGISKKINTIDSTKITIPRFGETQQTESLNVATATAILLNEFRRNFID